MLQCYTLMFRCYALMLQCYALMLHCRGYVSYTLYANHLEKGYIHCTLQFHPALTLYLTHGYIFNPSQSRSFQPSADFVSDILTFPHIQFILVSLLRCLHHSISTMGSQGHFLFHYLYFPHCPLFLPNQLQDLDPPTPSILFHIILALNHLPIFQL